MILPSLPSLQFLSLHFTIKRAPNTKIWPNKLSHSNSSFLDLNRNREKKMALINRAYVYEKMESEDVEEVKHRRAQFLIYKSLQKADGRRRPSWLRVKMFKLKIKIGKRLKKSFSSTVFFSAKADFYKQIAFLLKSCKHFIHGKQEPVTGNLHPIFWEFILFLFTFVSFLFFLEYFVYYFVKT